LNLRTSDLASFKDLAECVEGQVTSNIIVSCLQFVVYVVNPRQGLGHMLFNFSSEDYELFFVLLDKAETLHFFVDSTKVVRESLYYPLMWLYGRFIHVCHRFKITYFVR